MFSLDEFFNGDISILLGSASDLAELNLFFQRIGKEDACMKIGEEDIFCFPSQIHIENLVLKWGRQGECIPYSDARASFLGVESGKILVI